MAAIIPTRNGRHRLARGLPALISSAEVALEIVVVDNGSTDGTVAWLREQYPSVTVVECGRNTGFGHAVSLGVRACRQALVAFLNDDTVVERDWLRPLRCALKGDPAVAAACSTLRLLDRPDILNARGGGLSRYGLGYDRALFCPWTPYAHREPVDVAFPTAAAMLMAKADFEAAGGFDPAFFMYHEDVDLGWRLWVTGRRVVWCPDSVVFHERGGSSTGTGLRDRLGARHCVRSLLVNYHPENVLRTTIGLARHWIRTGQYGRLADTVAWNLRQLPGTLRRRWQVQKRRVRSDGELFRLGVLDGDPFPPLPPPLSETDPARDFGGWLETPTLLPAHDSGASRLGPGWYGPETVADKRARHTAGLANAFLRVPADRSGRVVALVRGRELTLCANDARSHHELDADEWQEVAVPAQADARGLVRVTIEGRVAVAALRFEDGARPRVQVASRPRVSVVVPTHDRIAMLGDVLAALEGQTWPDMEVVVVDDGSRDGTWSWLERRAASASRPVRVFRQENRGPGPARNLGVSRATGDLVLFHDDDILPDPGCIAAHVAAHRRLGERCAVVGFVDWDRGHVRVTPFLEHVNLQGPQFGFGLLHDRRDTPFTCLYTCNVSIPRGVLGDAPFHPSIPTAGWEDIELGYRLSRRGLRIVYERAASARHRHALDLPRFVDRQRRMGAAIAPLLALHPQLEAVLVPPALRMEAVLGPVVDAAAPVLAALDRWGTPLPARAYGALLARAFHGGFRAGPQGVTAAGAPAVITR